MIKPVVHTQLKNGIQLITVPHEDATSVTIMVFVKVGSRYETKELNGASHFIEHMMFKGTKKRPTSLDISRELDRFGAEYNAYTAKDVTAYYIKIDAEKQKLAIDLLNDMLFHSKFEAEEVARERGVIIEEIHMYQDNPASHMEDLLEEALFPNSTLGWAIVGPKENIKSMSRDGLVGYRDAYYIPSRMTIAASGKLSVDFKMLLEKTFGSVRQPKETQDAPFTPFVMTPNHPEWLKFQYKKTEQVQLGMAFPGYKYGDPHGAAARFLGLILGGSMSSRLFIEVREKRGLCYSIHASHQSLEDTGLFVVSSGLERTRFAEAVQVIWKELQRIAKQGIDATELRQAKDHLRGKLMLHFEDSANQADWYGKQWVYQKKLVTPEERMKEMNKVTAKQIQEVAKAIFQGKNLHVSVVGPFEDPEELKAIFAFRK